MQTKNTLKITSYGVDSRPNIKRVILFKVLNCASIFTSCGEFFPLLHL